MNKMEYLKYEESLIQTAIDIKHTEMLSKLDTEISKREGKTIENLSFEVKTVEELSNGDFTLPFKIRGKMLGVGRFKTKFYTEEALIEVAERYKNKTFPLKLDHRHREAGSTIGLVDRIYWSPSEKALRYEAHINSETHARNANDGAHKEVSANIESFNRFNSLYGKVGYDLDFDELSIVWKGSYPGNTLEADN